MNIKLELTPDELILAFQSLVKLNVNDDKDIEVQKSLMHKLSNRIKTSLENELHKLNHDLYQTWNMDQEKKIKTMIHENHVIQHKLGEKNVSNKRKSS